MNKVQLPAIECICIRFINNKLENAQTRIFSEFDSKLYKYQHLSIECFFCNPPNPETINNFKKKKKKGAQCTVACGSCHLVPFCQRYIPTIM